MFGGGGGFEITSARKCGSLIQPPPTPSLFVIIYLMGNRNEKRDHLLRYCGFALVLVCQVKDGFWMQDSQYTVGVVVLFAVLYVMKLFVQVKTPPYNRPKVCEGV